MSENEARIGGFGFIETGETLGVLRVVEVTGIDDHARDRGAMSAQVLRSRIYFGIGKFIFYLLPYQRLTAKFTI